MRREHPGLAAEVGCATPDGQHPVLEDLFAQASITDDEDQPKSTS
jgi:hypothetical protein